MVPIARAVVLNLARAPPYLAIWDGQSGCPDTRLPSPGPRGMQVGVTQRPSAERLRAPCVLGAGCRAGRGAGSQCSALPSTSPGSIPSINHWSTAPFVASRCFGKHSRRSALTPLLIPATRWHRSPHSEPLPRQQGLVALRRTDKGLPGRWKMPSIQQAPGDRRLARAGRWQSPALGEVVSAPAAQALKNAQARSWRLIYK